MGRRIVRPECKRADMQAPVKLHQNRGQRLRNSVACEDLLNRVKMARADFRARIFVHGFGERTEYRSYGGREKFPELAKALQRRPFESKKVFVERFIAGMAAMKVLFGCFEGLADDGGGNRFLRREVVKESSIRDSGGGRDVARGDVFPALREQQIRRRRQNPLSRGQSGLGCDSQNVRRSLNEHAHIKYRSACPACQSVFYEPHSRRNSFRNRAGSPVSMSTGSSPFLDGRRTTLVLSPRYIRTSAPLATR